MQDTETTKKLIATALGRQAADLAVVNANLVNVFTTEIQPQSTITVSNGKIASIGTLPPGALGPETIIIDARGDFVLPGYIETHTHIANVFRLHDFCAAVLPHGTTTVFSEATELGNSLGRRGLSWLLEEAAGLPLDLNFTAPCFSPTYPDFESTYAISLTEYEELFQNKKIAGIGEAYWPDILAADERTLELLALAHHYNKPVQGHSAGAKEAQLNAFVAAGISSCHEPINPEQALDRLRLGLHLMIREGSIRRDLAGVAPVKELTRESRRMSISTDGVTPSWLLNEGHLDSLGQKAVSLGFDPLTVVQMLTLNAAEAFQRQDIGALAPGRRADILIVPQLEKFTPRVVLCRGEVRADQGELKNTASYTPYSYPPAAYNSLPLKPVTAATFLYPTAKSNQVKVRAIKPEIGSMVTHEVTPTLKIEQGNILADPLQDIIKYVVFDRYGSKRIARGFLAGTGIQRGAWASTLNWECYQPTVIGCNEEEMACAFNRLLEIKGGIVVVEKSRILAELPLPIGGIMADLGLREILTREEQIVEALTTLGSKLDNPFFHYQTLAFTGLPFLRLTDKGLFDVRKRSLVPLEID
ncbi:MAG: adenine deaminase C-terminal domain-containing protein [Pseudomonadota bacterium]|nr:adenine deaminase C-terminal domain-containing protein [Pseudomonadota bacterium]